MKYLYFLLFLPLLLVLTSCAGEPEVDMEAERQQVMTLLDNFVKAHEEKNLDMLLSCFSDKPDITIIGTDRDELWVDKVSMGEAQRRAYETFGEVKLSVRDKILKLCPDGEIAWFYMKVNWYVESEGETSTFDGIRTTGVLEKTGGKWAIAQIHTSMPVEGQAVRY